VDAPDFSLWVVHIQSILEYLSRDPIRTRTLTGEIKSRGLDYSINRIFPLNDFFNGSLSYLRRLKVSEDFIRNFSRELSRDVLFAD